MMLETTPTVGRLIRMREVCRLTALSRSEIYRRISSGRFPAGVKLGPATTAWVENDVLRWIGQHVAAGRRVDAA